MKILIVEYITGGGLRRKTIPASLAQEGELMFRALMEDLLQLSGVELVVFRDDRLNALQTTPDYMAVKTVSIGDADDFKALWLAWVARCDAAWPIAPETDGILEELCRGVQAGGKILLNSPAFAVRLAASKLATARRLEQKGLPVVPTVPLNDWAALTGPGYLVMKPDDGVGCEGARIVRKLSDLTMPTDAEKWIAQPLLEREALSLSVLFAQGQARLLSCNRQHVARTLGGFALRGCLVNALADASGAWQRLAAGIARAFPELWGYAGVDLIVTDTGPAILEINPRLTTSYAGLRKATGENVAGLVLDLLATGELPQPRTDPGKPVEIRLETTLEH